MPSYMLMTLSSSESSSGTSQGSSPTLSSGSSFISRSESSLSRAISPVFRALFSRDINGCLCRNLGISRTWELEAPVTLCMVVVEHAFLDGALQSGLMALKTGTIRQKVLIPSVTHEEVYEAIIDPKKHSAFTGSKAMCNPRPGGRFTAWDNSSSLLEFTLTRKKGGTELRMVHSKVPASQVENTVKDGTARTGSPSKNTFGKS